MKIKRFNSFLLILSLVLSLFSAFSVEAEEIWDPFNGDKNVNIVYFGGSITNGRGYRTDIGEYLIDTYEKIVPGRKITNHNAGIGGTGSDYGYLRLNRDVISKNPDLVFVEFAVNDVGADETVVNESMEGIVRNLQSLKNPPMIIFVYTTGTNFKNASEIHHKIAEYYNIPELDFRQYMIDEGYEGVTGVTYENLPSRLKALWSDLTHPNSDGHKLWSDYAIEEFKTNAKNWFAHPIIRKNKLSSSLKDGFNLKWEAAKEAYDNGTLKISGKTQDYSISDEGGLLIKKDVSAQYTFSGKNIHVYGKYRTDGGRINVSCEGKTENKDMYSLYNNLDCSVYKNYGLNEGEHILTIESSDVIPSGSTGSNVTIDGFFVDADMLVYPSEYPEDASINIREDESAKNEDTAQEQSKSKLYEKELVMAKDIGILTEEQFEKADEPIARKEFARLLCRIIEPFNDENQQWYSEVFSQDKNFITVEKTEAGENIFEDVEVNNEYIDDIHAVYSKDLMIGKTETEFAPDDNLTINEALKAFVNMMGYSELAQMHGGYTSGYMYVAQSLDLLNGLKYSSADDAISIAEISRILYNMYDQKIFGITSIDAGNATYEPTNDTFLTRYMKMDWIKGRVTKTLMTSLAGDTSANEIIIGGFNFIAEEKDVYINNYLGRTVTAYYKEDDGECYLVAVYPSDNEDIIELSAEDFVDYSDQKLYYIDNSSLGREKSVYISENADIVYNGGIISVFDKNIFEFAKGNITLISTERDKKYNIVIIDSYEDWNVILNDSRNLKLYRKAVAGSSEEDNCLDYSEDSKIEVRDALGNYIDIETIEVGDKLLVAKNADYAKIIKSSEAESNFVVSSIEKNGYKEKYDIISNGEKSYTIVSDYINTDGFVKPALNNTYTLYLDSFGFVSWIELTAAAEKQEGFVRQVSVVYSDETGEESLLIKIIGFDSVVNKYEAAPKMKITDDKGETYTCKNVSAMNAILGGYVGYMSYKLDENGRISSAQLARSVEDKTGNPDVVYDLIKTENMQSNEFGAKSYVNMFSSATDRIYLKNNETKILYCPQDIEEYKYRASNTMSDFFTTDVQYTVYAYGKKLNTCIADYIICDTAPASESKFYMRENVYLVNKIESTVIDDEIADKIYATKLDANGMATQTELYTTKRDSTDGNGNECSFRDACPNLLQTGELYKIESGDIIAAVVDKFNDGFINDAYMIYKSKAYAPDATDGVRPGWIVGAVSKYDDTNKTLNGNPYAVNNSLLSDAKSYTVYGTRVLKGYVLSYIDGVLKYTTQDLSAGASYNPELSGYITNIDKSLKVYVLNYKGDNVNVTGASETQIKTYDNYGSNASAILTVSYGLEGVALIINNN